MSNVIDFSKFIMKDGEGWFDPTTGTYWNPYICSFDVEGVEYSFNIWERSFADAEKRLSGLKNSARVTGQLCMTVDA